MTDAVTVFVDDAVLGRLPSICVKDGVFTEDRLTQTLAIGDQGLGIAWLLILFGPLGWIVLIGIAVSRTPSEVLRVELPMSEAAYGREVAARRAYRRNGALVTVGAFGLLVALFMHSSSSPALSLLWALAAGSVLAGGVIGTILAWRAVREASVELGLDASRRWVYIWGVHPNFAAEVNRRPLRPELSSQDG